jgi:WD40 repeat protein
MAEEPTTGDKPRRPARSITFVVVAAVVAVAVVLGVGLAHRIRLDTPRTVLGPEDDGWGDSWDIAFSPNGQILAVTRYRGEASLWDVGAGTKVGKIDDEANAVAFSPDGRTMATCGPTGARLRDAATGRPTAGELEATKDCDAVAFNRDGTLVAAVTDAHYVEWWDVASRRRLGYVQHWVQQVVFGPDGRTMVVATDPYGGLALVDLATGKPLPDYAQPFHAVPGGSLQLAASPAGPLLAASVSSSDGLTDGVFLWDVERQLRWGGLENPDGTRYTDTARSLAFSPDGEKLATAGYDGTLRLWDVETRRQIGDPVARRDGDEVVRTVLFSPDGATLAAASDHDRAVRLFDVGAHGPRRWWWL